MTKDVNNFKSINILCHITEINVGINMEYKQVFHNAKWIIVCKIIESILQLVIGMLSARYLGPSNYGLISYASSIIAFVMPVMKLGIGSVIIHKLVESPEKEGEIVGTALVMNVLSSFACIISVAGFVTVFNMNDRVTIMVCILYSLSLFFSALEMIQYWFQYKLQSKYSSIVMLIAYVFVSAYKIYILATQKSIYWFALTNSLDYGIIGITLIMIYMKKGQRFKFSFSTAKDLINMGKHYLLASLMMVVFQNTDRIMLTSINGETQNGYYTAAVTCVGVAQFVYTAIIDSYRPMILANKKENAEAYKRNICELYCLIIYLSIAQSIAFTILAKPIIGILFGSDYAPAIEVLRILVWFLAFSFMGSIRNVWILAEEKQKYLWIINLSGAAFNIMLNIVAIPLFGAVGAAATSLLTQIFTNFVLGFIIKPIRENNKLLLYGLNPKFAINGFSKMIGLIKNKT